MIFFIKRTTATHYVYNTFPISKNLIYPNYLLNQASNIQNSKPANNRIDLTNTFNKAVFLAMFIKSTCLKVKT